MKLSEFLVQVFGSERSNDEFDQLNTWKAEGELNAKHLKEMTVLHSISNDLKNYESFDVEAALASSMERLEPIENNNNSNNKLILWISAAILAVLLSIYVYNSYNSNRSETFLASSSLEEIMLEDGTKFHLNDGASVKLSKSTNHMALTGEGFFDVTKQEKPLTISTSMGDIEVLGTSFNVRSDEKYTEVIMFSGEISFTTNNEQTKVIKDQGVRITDEGIQLFDINNNQVYNYWLKKELTYKSAPLANVLTDLERLYGRDYSEMKNKALDLSVTASFKDASFEDIQNELSVITGLDF